MEYRELSEAKLHEKVDELRSSLKDLRFELKTGTLSDLKEYREAKRELSKALTVLNEKRLGINADLKPKKEVKVKEDKKDKEEKEENKKESKTKETKSSKKSK